MRFGIMSSQMNLLIPPGITNQGLFTHIANLDHAQLIRQLSEAGFYLIELSGDLAALMPHLYQPNAIQDLIALKAERNLIYTVHLPLWSVEPSTFLNPVRDGSVKSLITHIQSVEHLEPEIYVLHATGALAAEFYRMNLPELVKTHLLRQFQNHARESIQILLDGTGIPNRKLAIETIEFPFEMTLELAEDLDLSICLDTGHILAGFSGPINLFEAFERSLPRLAEIHLHDCSRNGDEGRIGYGKDHQALGNGILDINRFLDRLHTEKFNGPIIFELTIKEALKSLTVIQETRQDLICCVKPG